MPTDLIGQLAQNGLPSLLLAISLVANIFLYKEGQKSKQFVIDYLLSKGEKDGELKNQLLTFMQTLTTLMTQSKK